MSKMHKYTVTVKNPEDKEKVEKMLRSAGLRITRTSDTEVVGKDAPSAGGAFRERKSHERKYVTLDAVTQKLQSCIDSIEKLVYLSDTDTIPTHTIEEYEVKGHQFKQK